MTTDLEQPPPPRPFPSPGTPHPPAARSDIPAQRGQAWRSGAKSGGDFKSPPELVQPPPPRPFPSPGIPHPPAAAPGIPAQRLVLRRGTVRQRSKPSTVPQKTLPLSRFQPNQAFAMSAKPANVSPLNEVQVMLLRLFSRPVSPAHLEAIRNLLLEYYETLLQEEVDRTTREKGITRANFDKVLNEQQRPV